jgi:glycosyltransferase involved in cell wall biosynthesis
MCVGRAILGSIPSANLAARLIGENDAGVVADPDDQAGFIAAARRLAADEGRRDGHGRAARAYAERAFDIEAITSKFERIANLVTERDGIFHE